MAIRNNQKMVVFNNKDLINEVIKEEAKKKNINTSNVIEDNLLLFMFTQNSNIRHWLTALYSDEITMKQFMEAVWGLLAVDSVNGLKTKENIKIVKIAKEMADGQMADIYNKMFSGGYCPNYLNSQLDSIATRCEQIVVEAKETDDFLLEIIKSNEITKNLTTTHFIQNIKRYHYTEEINEISKHIRKMSERYSLDVNSIYLEDLYQIVIDAWEYIYEYSFTYKLLLELAKLQKHFDINWRYDVRQALIHASSSWN